LRDRIDEIERNSNAIETKNKDEIRALIVGSLSGSRLKSVRFLVGESSGAVASCGAVASYGAVKTIKINH
jgi:hypothetical protein